MSEYIAIRRQEGIQTIGIDRPEKKNALTAPMYAAMTGALREGDADDNVRVHLFKGVPGAFTAGNDISEFLTFAQGGSLGGDVVDFLHQLALTEKPMVAAVNGLAIGIGTTMLLHCDVVFATPGSTFRTPFLDLGLVPEAGSSLLAPQLMGPQRSFELLCLGNTFSGEDARRAGIVNRLVGPDAIDSDSMAACRALAAKPPAALKAARDLIRGPREPVLARIDEEVALFAERLRSPEAREAFAAFMEKRPANFKPAAE